jgi:hypothetical protein
VRKIPVVISTLVLAGVIAGCGSTSAPQSAPPPPNTPGRSALNPESPPADSVGVVKGSEGAQYVYRFRQTEPASSGTFAFRDRDLSFSFRPSPNALFFGVENLQGRPVQIDWERSVFYDPNERTGKVGHSTTRWRDRFSVQAVTQILPVQRYNDYVFSMDDLSDPAGSPDTQMRRPLFAEDSSAPTNADKSFGVDLVFQIENQPRTYSFRFQVVSVIPR